MLPHASGHPRVLPAALAVLILVGAFAWLQALLADLPSAGLTVAPGAGGLTQAYTTALAKGQAHLDATPDARLLALPNPYDPRENTGYRLLDVSLYDSRYYLYFGIAPWAVLLVPWFKITGTHLSDAAAIWIFCAVGLFFYTLALFRARQRWFPTVSLSVFLLAGLVPAVASGTWSLVALPQLTQLPSAGAYAFFAFACLGLVCAEADEKRRIIWLALAMLSAGLVMGCRPNYAPAVGLLAVWACVRAWQHCPTRHWRALAVVALPLCLVGALLAAWNYARFGSPLEFGLRYQLADVNREADEGGLAARHLVFNLHRYLFGAARLADYFPFIAGESPGPIALSRGREHSDQVYGIFWILPALLFAPLNLTLAKSHPVRRLVAYLLAASLGNLLLLAAFGGGAYRYPVDFAAPLALAAALGVLRLAVAPVGWPRRCGIGLLGVLLGWSAAAVLFQTVSLYDEFGRRFPRGFQELARPFNAAVYLGESLRRDGPRALRLELTFPRDRNSLVEPLVVVGSPSQQDFLYVYYSTPDHIQIGFESIGRGGPVSRQVIVDYRRVHTLELRYGSFLPPADHPLLRRLSPADRVLAGRMLTVLLDGEVVLDGWGDFHPPRGVVHIGLSPDNPAFGPRFTGMIHRIERPPLSALASPARWDSTRYGPLAFNIDLRSAPATAREPLLSLGHRNQGALLVLERLADDQVRLGYLPTAGLEHWSSPITWHQNLARTLTLDLGALLPPITASVWPGTIALAQRSAEKRRLKIHLDDQIVWSTSVEPLDVSPETVVVGRNDLQTAGVTPSPSALFDLPARTSWPSATAPAATSAPSAESAPKNADRTSNRR